MSQCLDILTDRWGNPLSRARRLAMAHDYWCRFCDILRKGSVGYPSDLSNLRNLYVYLDRAGSSWQSKAGARPMNSRTGC